jgi:hypothetical protein
MIEMSSLQDRYIGRPAAVLGGGPSLPDDFARLPERCVLIAVNYHAFHLCQPDFMVYNDQPESDPLLLEAVCNRKATLVSSDPTSDIHFDVPVWTGFYSSNTAAWFALWMGCNPVILCGMDCYQGEAKYFHSYQHDVPVFHYPLDHHLRPWYEEGKARLPHVERLRAMSGPLAQIFGLYQEPHEALAI